MNINDLIIWKRQQQERERQQQDNRIPLHIPDTDNQTKEKRDENRTNIYRT